ncbi:VRR-NUC domain-containing protein [Gynuella sp.]|uniref:VRR-NUC domain-containing protein n=1 Tax=Gynuella sp. TaxID=2969146 RepID=UPI003D0B71A6
MSYFPEVDQPYYLSNFHTLLQWVEQRYDDLLLPTEHDFLEIFRQLSVASQCLLVRMLMRTKQYFRCSKLVYPEVDHIDVAVKELCLHELVEIDPVIDIEIVTGQMLKAELLACFGHELALPKASKKQLSEQLYECYGLQSKKHWSQWAAELDDPLIQLQCQDMFDCFCLMFFGNPYQDLTEFVLTDLGLFRYEVIPFDDSTRAFQTRQQIEFYRQLLISREFLEQGLTDQALDSLPEPINSDWLNQKRDKALYRIGYDYERKSEFDQALDCYLDNDYCRARERHIRVLEKQQRYEEAFQLCELALAEPLDENEQQSCQKMIKRLARKVARKVSVAVMAPIEQHTTQLDCRPEPVELLAAESLTSSSRQAVYVENSLFNGLFGLTFWEAIFKPCPGAFFHPFQSAPRDLYTTDFASTRAGEIAAGWERMQQPGYHKWLAGRYQEKHGIANPFVNWSVIDETLLQSVQRCIPIQHLRTVFERILFDIKSNSSGFPDLVVFDSDRPCYRLVEVKGPGDRLQDNQIRWFNYFIRHQIPASVLYVQWLNDANS